MKILFLLLVLVCFGYGQTIYSVPAGSKQNSIELTITNNIGTNTSNTIVEIEKSPSWINFSEKKIILQNNVKKSDAIVHFDFTILPNAVVDEEGSIILSVKNSAGLKINKEYRIKISNPYVFTLEQNYPNPFNPSTVISYQLPISNHVSLKVYDAIGREVATLVNEIKVAGSHSIVFDVSKLSRQNVGGLASGIYFYTIKAGSFNSIRKMILMK